MPNYTIGGSNSIDVTGADGLSLATGEKVTVTREGSIKTSGGPFYGIESQGNNTIIIDGLVSSQDYIGVAAYNGNVSIVNAGQIYGSRNAISLFGGSHTIHNSGNIAVSESGITAIQFTLSPNGSSLTVFNTGTIIGVKDILNPYSPRQGAIYNPSGAQAYTLINTGSVQGAIVLSDGNDIYFGQGGLIDCLIDLGYGNDQVYGGSGSEIIKITHGSDTIDGGEGIDTIVINDTAITIDLGRTDAQETGVFGKDVIRNIENITGGSQADNLTGNQFNNVFTAREGNDTLKGGGGDDLLRGGADHDTLSGDQGNDTLDGGYAGNEGFGNDTLNGGEGFDTAVFQGAEGFDQAVFVNMANPQDARNTDGADVYISIEQLIGTKFADTFIGDASGSIFNGAGGNDTLDGGAGVDTAVYTSAATVNLAAGTAITAAEGTDTLTAIENVTGSEQADRLTGDAAANVLAGNGGNDTLDGGAGADRLVGGAGDDVYYADALDTVVESAGGGIDIVYTSAGTIDLAAFAHVEHVIATSLGSVVVNGDAGANTLNGGSASDMLNGAAGADVMKGGTGNDVYHVDNASDVVSELAGGGLDSVFSSVSFALAGEVENLTATGSAGISLTGNGLANTLTGNAGRNTLKGGSGNDKLWGGLGKDTLYGQSGRDVFVFDDRETGSSKGRADYLADFSGRGGDKIDLRLIDANATRSGDQRFSFIGTEAFSGVGQARYEKAGGYTYVYLNTDRDMAAEGVLKIKGAMNLSKGWFVL